LNNRDERAHGFLLHMAEALDRILRYTDGIESQVFFENEMLQDAVVRNIGVIGEAAKQLLDAAPEFPAKYPEIPFGQIYGMRNRVIHGYASVDPKVVWETVQLDVPELRKQLAVLLREIDPSCPSG
jgi:uncharacterized protein with HEPN domain